MPGKTPAKRLSRRAFLTKLASQTKHTNDPRRPDNIDVEVGRLVRVQRISRGLSQTELGNQIGVTFQQVQKYESGGNRISIGRLTRIGRVLGVSVTYLLGANRRATPTAAKDQAKYSEAMGMLGKSGAVRLLRTFNAIPKKRAPLREMIVQLVENLSAAPMVRSIPRKTPRKKKRNG